MNKIKIISLIITVFALLRLPAKAGPREDYYIKSLSKSNNPEMASLVIDLRFKIDSEAEIGIPVWEKLGKLFQEAKSPVRFHQSNPSPDRFSPELNVFRRFMKDFLRQPGNKVYLNAFLKNWVVEDAPGLALKTSMLKYIKKKEESAALVGDGSWLLRDLLSALAFEETFFIWQTENPGESLPAYSARALNDTEMEEAVKKGEDRLAEKKAYYEKWQSLLANGKYKEAKEYHKRVLDKENKRGETGSLIFLPGWQVLGQVVDYSVNLLTSEKS